MDEIGNTALTYDTSDEEFHTISNITRDERDMLARVAFCEAGTEGIDGMRRVVDVILNRRDSNKFPNTIKEVLYSPGQFTTIEASEHVADHVLHNAFKAVDMEINTKDRLDSKSLYFGRKPHTKNGVYKEGRHYFSW